MRKLIFAINMTIDGCYDHTLGTPDDEVHDFFTDLMRHADLNIYGRKTYELMVPFWPHMAREQNAPTKALKDFAQVFDSVNRVVFSRTLAKVSDEKTTVINGRLQEEVRKLKQQPGTYMLTGGVDLPSQLMALSLVDEYYFVVHPVMTGDGRRLFGDTNLPEKLQLKLAGTRVFASGCVALHYTK